MEGERILQNILRGDVKQWQYIQNYISPLDNLLGSDLVNCVGRKAVDYEQIIRKYGLFCMKLLRYSIEVISKGKKQSNGHNSLVQEECFRYSELGADMLTKLVESDMNLPSDLSIPSISKLLFHLIINALKDEDHSHLLLFTNCLITITRRTAELGQDNMSKETTSICKQASDHLWNAAIKLEQSNSMEKHTKAVLALSLRNNSLDLFTVAKNDLSLMIERGLKAARQFQLGCTEASGCDELKTFLFGLLGKAVALIDNKTFSNHGLKESAYSILEDLCTNCCKVAADASHFNELLELLSHLIKKDAKNTTSQGRFRVFQIVIQMLQCALCFRLKRGKSSENQKFHNDLKWSTLQKRLTNITEVLGNIDSKFYRESQIIQAMDHLRFACNKLFNPKTDEASGTNLDKTPQEPLLSLVNLFLVCSNIQDYVFKSARKHGSSQLISNCTSWKSIVHPRLSMLYLISSLILKMSHDGLAKASQNGRKISFKYDYVSAMIEVKSMLDDVGGEVPAVSEHYRYIATDAFNVGLIFLKRCQINDATTLARISCEAGNTWCLEKCGSNQVLEVLLFKKYELFSDCLEKQGEWHESLRAMTRCCQLYALSRADFAETGLSDNKALEYVDKWSTRKHRAVKHLGEGKDSLQVKRCILDDGWKQVGGSVANEKEIHTLLKMELVSYRKKGYCTSVEELAVIERLVSFFENNNDNVNACSVKLEKLQIIYQMNGQHNETEANVSQCTCEEIIADLNELSQQDRDSIMVKNILASSYFWCFILQYSKTIRQGVVRKDFEDETDGEETLESEVTQNVSKMNSLGLLPDFLLSLHAAVKIWSEMVDKMAKSNTKQLDVVSLSETCWKLQIASSVYGFLNMPLVRIHTLSVLAAIARTLGGNENLQTAVVVDSFAIQVLCDEGNLRSAEMLTKRCEEIIEGLGDDCQPVTRYLFHIAKSHLLLLKGMYDDGLELVKDIIKDVNGSKKPVLQLILVKAKVLYSKYLSLPSSITGKTHLSDGYTHLEMLLDSLKHAEALMSHFVRDEEENGVSHLNVGGSRREGNLWDYYTIFNNTILVLEPDEGTFYDWVEMETKEDVCKSTSSDTLWYPHNFLQYFAGVIRNKHKEQYGILLSHWSVLNEMSCCLMETGKVFLLQGAVREAKKYLEDGRNIANQFSSPSRLSEFTIQLVELNIVKNETKLCETCLKQVLHVLKPAASLSQLGGIPAPFEVSCDSERSCFNAYDKVLVAKLHIQLLISYCQYLMMEGELSDAKKLIFSLRDLRQASIEQYQTSLESLERIFEMTGRGERSVELNDEQSHVSGKRNTKGKTKRGKTTTKLNEKKTTLEFLPGKTEVASVVFLEIGVKIHALQSDLALSQADYTTLLSSVQEGLKLVQWAQHIVKNPCLLGLMSTSLLHYLRGVAHVLSSKAGFDSWRVSGCAPSNCGHGQRTAVQDISDVLSNIDISPTVVENPDGRATGIGAETSEEQSEERDPCSERLLRDSTWDDWECNTEVRAGVENKARKRARGRCNVAKHLGSEKLPKRTPVPQSRKKSSRKNVVANDNVSVWNGELGTTLAASNETTCEDVHVKKESKNVKKCTRSARKDMANSEEVLIKSSAKTRRNVCRVKNYNNPSNNGDIEYKKSPIQTSVVLEEVRPKRSRATRGRSSKKKFGTLNDAGTENEANVVQEAEEKHFGSLSEKDEEILKALECFHLSLEYLHPNYNPVLLGRICHALVLCHGLKCPVNAAIYHNLTMAVTLRHQAMNSSAKKIRKVKEGLTVDQIRDNDGDELTTLFDSMTLDDSNKANLSRLSHLRTIKKAIGFKTSKDEALESFNHFMDLLPQDWTVCTLSIVPVPGRENVKHLVITRLRKQQEPLVLKLTLPNDEDEMEEEFQTGHSLVRDLSAIFRKDIFSDFAAILRESAQSMHLESKQQWWERRGQIDAQLQRLVQRLEDTWFGKWRGILSGRMLEEENLSQLQLDVKELQVKAVEIFGAPVGNEQLLEVLVEWFPYLKLSEVTCALAEVTCALTGMQSTSVQVTKFSQVLKHFVAKNIDRTSNPTSVSRGPVVLILDKAIQHLPFESMPILRHQEVSRMPSLDFITSHLSLQRVTKPAPIDILTSGVDPCKTFYVLNPKNDLPKTEKIFHGWFSGEKGWSGVVGRPPTAVEFKEALSSHHLFLYFGHGTGREFLKGDEVQRLYCQAVAVLMGCSSGKLLVQGNCDARGMALNYLLSGCPTVVANLWDVTDGDIDRFSDALLKTWLNKDNKLSLTQCVTQCRSVCKLKYLIGSSPVVYGMPVYTRTPTK